MVIRSGVEQAAKAIPHEAQNRSVSPCGYCKSITATPVLYWGASTGNSDKGVSALNGWQPSTEKLPTFFLMVKRRKH